MASSSKISRLIKQPNSADIEVLAYHIRPLKNWHGLHCTLNDGKFTIKAFLKGQQNQVNKIAEFSNYKIKIKKYNVGSKPICIHITEYQISEEAYQIPQNVEPYVGSQTSTQSAPHQGFKNILTKQGISKLANGLGRSETVIVQIIQVINFKPLAVVISDGESSLQVQFLESIQLSYTDFGRLLYSLIQVKKTNVKKMNSNCGITIQSCSFLNLKIGNPQPYQISNAKNRNKKMSVEDSSQDNDEHQMVVRKQQENADKSKVMVEVGNGEKLQKNNKSEEITLKELLNREVNKPIKQKITLKAIQPLNSKSYYDLADKQGNQINAKSYNKQIQLGKWFEIAEFQISLNKFTGKRGANYFQKIQINLDKAKHFSYVDKKT